MGVLGVSLGLWCGCLPCHVSLGPDMGPWYGALSLVL
jgi:hypothetical protein